MGDEASRLTVRRAGRRAEAGEGRAWGTAAPAELPVFPLPRGSGPPSRASAPAFLHGRAFSDHKRQVTSTPHGPRRGWPAAGARTLSSPGPGVGQR